jgi:hypothetical protein
LEQLLTSEWIETATISISIPHPTSPTNTKEEHLLLPITGSEYLEKMVQLPFRIPLIDTQDVKAFLEQRYERFRPQEPKTQNTPTPREQFDEQPQESNQPNQRLLEFFATHIPPKPRKIIRTINLFESKEELMHSLGVDSILLAKLTLLELFAPKLFRSMQTKGFVRLFRWLVKWKSAHNSLSETMAIHQAILKAELPQIDRDSFLYLLGIIEQYYKSRVEFGFKHIVNSVTLIDSTTLACGGWNRKVTLLDISNRINIKSLEDGKRLVVGRRGESE